SLNECLMNSVMKKNNVKENKKGNEEAIIIPSGRDCIKVGDTVMIVTTHTGFNDILDILSKKESTHE
ncbi:MAG: hypothetical protein IIV45_02615, partial [Lachnospiraceae bacterium]|nr:hypothetical protein [Lachnospiraceae bacterium]